MGFHWGFALSALCGCRSVELRAPIYKHARAQSLPPLSEPSIELRYYLTTDDRIRFSGQSCRSRDLNTGAKIRASIGTKLHRLKKEEKEREGERERER